jgi:hypothetical protein
VRGRTLLRVLLLLTLHAVARQVDSALGLLLHTTLELPDLASSVFGLVEPADLSRSVASFLVGGLALWLGLSAVRARGLGEGWTGALDRAADASVFLLLRPALTLLALVSVTLRPTYPYGFTLPVALTQDWSLGQDLAAAAFALAPTFAVIAARTRIPAPRPWELGFVAFLGYALLSPAWARQWEFHTGNEPKTLRMAVAIGHGLTLDAEGVSAGMEDLEPLPLGQALSRVTRGLAHETGALLGALSQGQAAVGREAIRATRMSRQTVGGKNGGVYYVLAPGPSALLAPLLRVDRSLNRAAGTPGRLAVTLLAWNALSALLVAGLMLLVRDLTGRPGLAAAVAAGFAFLPPFYFYAYQFYPEMLGALALVFLFRPLLDPTGWSTGRALPFGLLLATLPWLHQKFLPVWAVLSIWSAVRCVRERTPRRALLALALPQVASGALFALYNFSITGSIRPDALFLAWGPSGVKAASAVWGIPGLLFDARYGLMPYAPLYLAAGAGWLAASETGRRLRVALPAVVVYFLTVASADNWSGAGCNLGRYLMPITPVLVALVAVGAQGLTLRPGAMGLFTTLALWSGVVGLLLGLDPHAANDCSRLLARSVFAEGEVYIPTLPLRDWAEAAPGLWMRVAVWTGFAAAVAWALDPRRAGVTDRRTLAGLVALLLIVALVLEHRWPSSRPAPRFPDTVEVGPGQTVFALRGARAESGRFVVEPGDVTLLVRQSAPGTLVLHAAGEGLLRLPGREAFPLRTSGIKVTLEPENLRELRDHRGGRELLGRLRLTLDGPASVAVELLSPP